MRQHEDLAAYLDRRLDDDRRRLFDRHLAECAKCRSAVESWRRFAGALREDAAAVAAPPPSAGEVATLLSRVRERRAPRRERVVALRWAVAIAALVALGVAAVLLARPGVSVAPLPAVAERPRADEALARIEIELHRADRIDRVQIIGELIEAPADGRAIARLGEDRIELGARGRLALLETGPATRLRLARGRVECRVAPRAATEPFLVEAGAVVVRVVGTSFVVARGADGTVEVSVDEGTVEVRRDAELLGRLGAGERLAVTAGGEPIAAVVESSSGVQAAAPIADAGADRPTSRSGARTGARGGGPAVWREWIVEGRLDEAAGALAAHLERQPGDTAAWSLLADCRRKQGRVGEAIEAYEQVIARAPAGEANRARFMAGSLAQDRLGAQTRAAELFAAYLEAPGRKPLAAEALVRRARALMSLGRDGAARPLLDRVLADHGGTQAAATARRLLEQLEEGR